MFKQEPLPDKHEKYCQYRNVAYHNVPGYVSGYGCPECGGIGPYHVPVQKSHRNRGIVEKEQSDE